MSEHVTVSVDEIAKRLHFTRNHIYKAMLPFIKHEKTRNRIQVDEDDLRRWLMDNASFSRQTKFVDDYDEPAWREYTAMLEACGVLPQNGQWRCPPPAQRSRLPFRSVRPFDFWDKELIFPDDPRFNNAESFYRAMYECAAVKIKLGERKTMFYAPSLEAVQHKKVNDVFRELDELTEELDELIEKDKNVRFYEPPIFHDISSVTGKEETFLMGASLFPAIDAEAEEEYYRKLKENHPPVVIRIEGEKTCVEKVRKTLAEAGLFTFDKDIEEARSASGNTLCLKIPDASIKYWAECVEKTNKRAYGWIELYGDEEPMDPEDL